MEERSSTTSSSTTTRVARDGGASSAGRLGSGAMFDAIAPRYDLVNRVLSLGIDQSWRRRTVQALELQPGAHVLDLATGTADLALSIVALHPDVHVVGLDPAFNMLQIGRRKVERAGLSGAIELQQGDAQRLPFPAGAFDAACMAFGIRNVEDRGAALLELARVVRPGGRIAILEFSEPEGTVLGALARFHVRHVVPRLGGALSGATEYRYLQRSIADFPSPESFAAQMRQAGLNVVEQVRLTFGVCVVHVAQAATEAQEKGA